jgi:hypothetical protein
MCKKQAELLGYKESPYDALLDDFEPGLTSSRMESIFTPLASELTEIVKKVKNKPKVDLPKAKYPIDIQVKMNHEIAKALGYDLEAGRIDVSPHPFYHRDSIQLTFALQRAIKRMIFGTRWVVLSTKPGTRFMSKVCQPKNMETRWANPLVWESMNRNRGCGKIL